MRYKEDGCYFWKIADKTIGNISWMEVAEKAALNYRTLVNQRSGARLPDATSILSISRVLGVSMEYLLTGKEQAKTQPFPSRVMKLAEHLSSLSEQQLDMIEPMVMSVQVEQPPKTKRQGA
ncbi:MAG: hypothetical protein WCR02_08750 [Sphaerochaetaceae bacterium]